MNPKQISSKLIYPISSEQMIPQTGQTVQTGQTGQITQTGQTQESNQTEQSQIQSSHFLTQLIFFNLSSKEYLTFQENNLFLQSLYKNHIIPHCNKEQIPLPSFENFCIFAFKHTLII